MNLNGSVALIVGGTRGIGKESARGLANSGARMVIVGRSADVGEATARELGHDVAYMQADVSLMREVRRVADDFRSRYNRLDILIHSADILRTKRIETDEGQEASFATNYLSRFLLNSLLLDLLQESAPSRIIHIAAPGFPGRLRSQAFPPPATASSFTGHNTGQRANDVYGLALAERLRGTGVTVNILNPGMVDTDIRRSGDGGRLLKLTLGLMETLSRRFTKSPAHYAQLVLTIATAPEWRDSTGQLVSPKGKLLRVPADRIEPHIREHVWTRSEQLTGLKVPIV